MQRLLKLLTSAQGTHTLAVMEGHADLLTIPVSAGGRFGAVNTLSVGGEKFRVRLEGDTVYGVDAREEDRLTELTKDLLL